MQCHAMRCNTFSRKISSSDSTTGITGICTSGAIRFQGFHLLCSLSNRQVILKVALVHKVPHQRDGRCQAFCPMPPARRQDHSFALFHHYAVGLSLPSIGEATKVRMLWIEEGGTAVHFIHRQTVEVLSILWWIADELLPTRI